LWFHLLKTPFARLPLNRPSGGRTFGLRKESTYSKPYLLFQWKVLNGKWYAEDCQLKTAYCKLPTVNCRLQSKKPVPFAGTGLLVLLTSQLK
jgi:hypothetical protein